MAGFRQELLVPPVSPGRMDSLSPVFTSDPGDEEPTRPIQMRKNQAFFPDHIDLSNSLMATPPANLESKLLKLCNKKFLNNKTFNGEEGASRLRHASSKSICSLIDDSAKRYYNSMAWPSRDVTMTRKTTSVFSEGDIPEEDPDFDDATSDISHDDSTMYSSPWLRSISRSISHHYDQRRRKSSQFSGVLDHYSPMQGMSGLYRTDGRYGGPQAGLRTTKNRAPLSNVFNIPRLSGDISDQDDNDAEDGEKTPMTEDDIKNAVVNVRNDLIKLRENDRKLLKQFIQIRFGIEYSAQSRSDNNRSCRDLSMLGTLPRSPAPSDQDTLAPGVFRQRALSLRATNIRGTGLHPSFTHTNYTIQESSCDRS